MDPIKILKRAWHILWNYRALWVFGLILALAGASSSGRGSNNGVEYKNEGQSVQAPLPENIQEGFKQFTQEMQKLFHEGLSAAGIPKQELTVLLWIGVIFILVGLALAIVLAIARYVAETAVIRMVDNYESSGSKMTIQQGFRIGWSRTSWRLFLINLLVNLPLILVVVLLLVSGLIIFLAVSRIIEQPSVITIVGSIGVLFLVIFLAVIVSILLRLMRQFFWRVCALENVGVRESLRRGFQMVRENWKSIGVMWLVMIGLAIAWAIVSIIAIILTIPLVVIMAVPGIIVAAIPVLLAGGLSSLFLSGWLPWLVGILFGLPLFLVIAFSPWLLFGSWQTVFTSTVWTLVYRELKALSALSAEAKPAEG